MRESQGANHFVGALTIATEMLGGVQAGVGVMLQQSEKVFPPDEIQLAGLQGFCGEFVGLAGDSGVQAKNFARLGDTKDERLAIARGSGQFDPTGADDINTARGLALHEQYRTLWKNARVLDLVEICYRLLGKIAKETRMTELADNAIFRSLQSVGRTHIEPTVTSYVTYLGVSWIFNACAKARWLLKFSVAASTMNA